MRMFEPLKSKQAQILTRCLAAERNNDELVKQPELPWFTQIIKQKIKLLNLPITFNDYALLAINAFAVSPGSAVVVLIDALNKYEGQEVTVDKLCTLYPFGFYTKEFMDDYIENQIKTKTLKWSEVYSNASDV